ncbi:hypothetical protein EDB86DRAFT_2997180 [Lactarius hatsudake]|nr:hypothetical protein EDB86DRAFT_2997180 [Lactarius hatsudake]
MCPISFLVQYALRFVQPVECAVLSVWTFLSFPHAHIIKPSCIAEKLDTDEKFVSAANPEGVQPFNDGCAISAESRDHETDEYDGRATKLVRLCRGGREP